MEKAEAAEILRFCSENRINVIPRAGKTATEGGLENWKDLTVVVDVLKLNRIISIDSYNMQAVVQTGVELQRLEDEQDGCQCLPVSVPDRHGYPAPAG